MTWRSRATATATATATSEPVVVPTAAPTSAPPVPTPTPSPALQRVNSNLTWSYDSSSKGTKFTTLTLSGVPKGATIEVRCSGKGCPRKTWVKKNAPAKLSLTVFRNKTLRRGATLEVRTLATGAIGKVVRLKIGAKRPAQTVLCLSPGAKSPARC